jgi:hypothetical protein
MEKKLVEIDAVFLQFRNKGCELRFINLQSHAFTLRQ